MLDDTLPLTLIEYDEWGNPNEEEYFNYIRSYSPYDNIEKQSYPDIYACGGINDTRVYYWEPVKWVARLRENNTSDSSILLRIEMNEGHGGKTGRFEKLNGIAEAYAFILTSHEID